MVIRTIILIPILSLFSGLAFGVGGELFSFLVSASTNEIITKVGSILFGGIISVVCVFAFIKLLIEPFIAKHRDKEVRARVESIEEREGDTYEGKVWKKVIYKYIYNDMQYSYETMTTDEDIHIGDEIVLKVSYKRPSKAYEPYEDMLFPKIIAFVTLSVFLYFGVTTVIGEVFNISFVPKEKSIYGSDMKDGKVDASDEYLYKAKLYKIKENVTLYLPEGYKEHTKKENSYAWVGPRKSNLIAVTIYETTTDVEHTYNEIIKSMNKYEKVIGEEERYIFNNNKFLVYEIEKEGVDNANYVISANNDYYMAIYICWEDDEEDPTKNILSSMEY